MEILLGIVAGLLTSFVVHLYRISIRAIQVRRVNGIFPIAQHNVTLVFAGRTDVRPQYDKDLFVHVEAIYALNRLSKLFAKYKTTCHYQVINELRNDETSDIEICIGGPRANVLTKTYLQQFCPDLYGEDGGVLPENKAMLVKMTIQASPYSREKSVLLLYGRGPLDTYCAIDFFCDEFEALLQPYFNRDNAAIRLNSIVIENVRKPMFDTDLTDTLFPPKVRS